MATLKEVRLKAGLTQEELAQQAGITASTIHYLERGAGRPRWETYQALKRVLGPDLDSVEFTVIPEKRRKNRKSAKGHDK
jgi:DNA-binding XRE family transcriptional regulator